MPFVNRDSRRVSRPAALAAALVIAGCAYRPIVDTAQPSFDPARYQADLGQCEAFAEQVNPAEQVGTGALLGAALGAGLGAIGGAFAGQVGTGAAIGAAVGGASGGAGGLGQAHLRREDVVRRCLTGRGYMVLN